MAEGQRSPESPVAQQVAVLAQLIAKPGREAAVRDDLLRLVEPTRAEAGNCSYNVHQLKTNPAAYYVLHSWADEAALDRHMASAHLRSFLEQTATDLVAPPMLTPARMLSRPDTSPDKPRPVANSADQMTLVPFFTIKHVEIDSVRRTHLSMVEPTRTEPGCIDYDLYQSVEEPSVMFFYENWSDQAALNQHMNTPNFYRFVRGEIDGKLVVPWTAHVMTMVSQPG